MICLSVPARERLRVGPRQGRCVCEWPLRIMLLADLKKQCMTIPTATYNNPLFLQTSCVKASLS